MKYEDVMAGLKLTASHYADPEEYEHLTNVNEMHALFRIKFYAMQKYKDAKSTSKCNKCYGRGYTVPFGGGRLRGCTCLREKK